MALAVRLLLIAITTCGVGSSTLFRSKKRRTKWGVAKTYSAANEKPMFVTATSRSVVNRAFLKLLRTLYIWQYIYTYVYIYILYTHRLKGPGNTHPPVLKSPDPCFVSKLEPRLKRFRRSWARNLPSNSTKHPSHPSHPSHPHPLNWAMGK